MKDKNILWVSFMLPYNNVPHAGGQTHNFYLKGLNKNHFGEIRLVSFSRKSEQSLKDIEEGINYDIIINDALEPSNIAFRIFWKIKKEICNNNPFRRDGGFQPSHIHSRIIRHMKQLKKNGYSPNIIILQWTQVVLSINEIKSIYPNIPIISIEEDVSFQSYYRRYFNEKGIVKRFLAQKKAYKLRRFEISCLNNSDLIIVNNTKDKKLLISNEIEREIWQWTPYYHSYYHLRHIGDNRDIVFFGAMGREENWRSAIWFINNVWPSFSGRDMRFIVIGNNPVNELKKYESDEIRILGYVNDVSPFFQHSLCLVAPLLLGAGIKVKVLEAMSAGLPVLTNSIGIEGIPAKNGEHYFHCEKAEEYSLAIEDILNEKHNIKTMSRMAKELINESFNFEESLEEFSNIVYKMVVRKNGE